MKKTYLFYDIESTGLNPAFDQVLQFAAIRTDLEFNEIDRCEIHITLREDVIPSPYAVITHLIAPSQMHNGLNEVEGTEKIHALFNEPGTISVGYNTLGFDDEFLRFSFYRNLLTPYTHQYANQCARMDIYPITLMYHLFNPTDFINWPEIDNKVSLKLENLSAANELAEGQAHDAMVDVEATLALAKLLARDKTMWQYCIEYFNKQTDGERIAKLSPAFKDNHLQHTEGLYIEGKMGYKNQFQAPVMLLGQHWHYKNQMIFLRLDLPELQEATLENIDKTTWVIRKKLGEPGFVLPAKDRFLEKLEPNRLAIVEQNKEWLLKNENIMKAIVDYHLDYKYPIVPMADTDSVLYQAGFLSYADQDRCKQFHLADMNNKLSLIEQFESEETRELAIRLIGRNYADKLSDDYQKIYNDYLQSALSNDDELVPIDYRKKKRFSLSQAEKEVEEIQKMNLNDAQNTVFKDYLKYLNNLT